MLTQTNAVDNVRFHIHSHAPNPPPRFHVPAYCEGLDFNFVFYFITIYEKLTEKGLKNFKNFKTSSEFAKNIWKKI
jgi:hypothetical protein